MMGFYHQDYPSEKKKKKKGASWKQSLCKSVLQVAFYFPQKSCINLKYSESMLILDNL